MTKKRWIVATVFAGLTCGIIVSFLFETKRVESQPTTPVDQKKATSISASKQNEPTSYVNPDRDKPSNADSKQPSKENSGAPWESKQSDQPEIVDRTSGNRDRVTPNVRDALDQLSSDLKKDDTRSNEHQITPDEKALILQYESQIEELERAKVRQVDQAIAQLSQEGRFFRQSQFVLQNMGLERFAIVPLMNEEMKKIDAERLRIRELTKTKLSRLVEEKR